MKKVYSTLMLASMMAASVSAANLAADMQQTVSFSSANKTLVENFDGVKKNNKTRSASTRALSSVEDVCGPYTISDDWWYPFEGDPGESPAFFIYHLDGNMVGIDVTEMGGTESLLATVDVSKGTLTIKADDNKDLYDMATMSLELRTIDWNDGGKTKIVSSITCNISEDGIIDFYDAVLLWKGASGYYYGCGNFYMNPVSYFSYNAADWISVGQASYLDGFLNPLIENEEDQIGFVDVDLYASKSVSGEFLLMNPYAQGEWAQAIDSTTGYIVFNISNPDCVTVSTLVRSGAMLDLGDGLEEFLFFNNEGYRVLNGMTTDAQVEEVEEAMDPFNETIADYLSSYDSETRTVKVRNGYFGLSTDPLGRYLWKSTDKSVGLTCQIVLPDLSGVNTVVADDANAPVKYFNLQGMEIANPEKGQLVIVKKGNKVSKVIK